MKTLSQYLYEEGVAGISPAAITSPSDTMGMGNPMPPSTTDGNPGSEPLTGKCKKEKCKKKKNCDK